MATNTFNPEDPLQRLDQPFDRMFEAEMKEWVTRLPKNDGKIFPSPDHPSHLVPLDDSVPLHGGQDTDDDSDRPEDESDKLISSADPHADSRV